MGDDNEREAILVQRLEQTKHLQGGCAVEVAGRLVGQHELRVVGECSRDRDTLALTTGQFTGQMSGAVLETDSFEQLFGASAARALAIALREGQAARHSPVR